MVNIFQESCQLFYLKVNVFIFYKFKTSYNTFCDEKKKKPNCNISIANYDGSQLMKQGNHE